MKAADGSGLVFEEAFRTHKLRVESYVRRRVRQDVDDLVEEVFLTAWKRRDSIPLNSDDQLLWLYATARRVIANKLRWRARLDRFNRASTPLVISAVGSAEIAHRSVHLALERMRLADRELLLLIEWDGLSVSAAAAVLGITPSATNKRLQSARESFTSLYSDLERLRHE